MAAQRAMAAVQRQAAAAAATTSAAAPAATVRTDAAAELRHAAITRGLRWMERFLADRRVLFELDEQMIGAFFDVFTTQTDPAVCELAKELALSTLNRLLPRLLNAHKANAMPRESFLDLLALCRYRRLGWDPEPAMQRADRAYAAMKKRTEAAASTSGPARTSKALVLRKLTSALFGVRLEQLGSCTTKMWFELLMFVFYVEFANSCYPGRFPVAWGMREALAALRTHRFVPPPWSPTSDFSECFYLATHVTYYLSCYTTNRREEMPWLYEYVELSMEFWMAQLRRRKSGERGEATDGLVYTDLEGVAEGLDVLRGLQPPSEPPTPTVIEATEWLLDQQKEDGSWAAIWHPKDPLWPQDEYDRLYFAIHPTWVTVYALCDRPSHLREQLAQSDGWLGAVQQTMSEVRFDTYNPRPAVGAAKSAGSGTPQLWTPAKKPTLLKQKKKKSAAGRTTGGGYLRKGEGKLSSLGARAASTAAGAAAAAATATSAQRGRRRLLLPAI